MLAQAFLLISAGGMNQRAATRNSARGMLAEKAR